MKWKALPSIVAALALGAVSMLAIAAGVKAGDEAPEIEYDKVFSGPEDPATDWYSLKDKVVVLQFWAQG